MIVVDTNLVAYLWIPSQSTPLAEAVLTRDSRWAAPYLWRSELRNALAQHLRRGLVDLATAQEIATRAEEQLAGCEFSVPAAPVLEAVASSTCSAYDCEFVVLARELGTRLVTADRKLARAFPKVAVHALDFAAR